MDSRLPTVPAVTQSRVMPRPARPDPPLRPLVLLDEAVEAGLTRHQVRQRVWSGAWDRVVRGAYVPDPERAFAGLDEFARARVQHVYRALAAAERNPGAVVCDASAALFGQLPLLAVPDRVQLGVPPGRWTGTRSGIDFRTRVFAPDELLDGRVPMARAARAWLDIACTHGLADALAAGDGGLRRGVLSARELEEMVARAGRRRGRARAARALSLVDAERESPLESASFAYLVEHRLPLPRCQVVLHDPRGRFLARVDFWWERAGLVGECDGRMKYASADDLYAEKRREDALRLEGFRVVRWSMGDLRDRRLADRLRHLLT